MTLATPHWQRIERVFLAYHMTRKGRPDAPPTDWRGKGRGLMTFACDICGVKVVCMASADGERYLWNGRGWAICGEPGLSPELS